MTTSTSENGGNRMINIDNSSEVFLVEEFIEILNESGWNHEDSLDSFECVDDDLTDLNNKRSVGAASRRSYNEKTGIIVEYFEGFVADKDGVEGSTEGMPFDDIIKIYKENGKTLIAENFREGVVHFANVETFIKFIDTDGDYVEVEDFFSDIPEIFTNIDYEKFGDLTDNC